MDFTPVSLYVLSVFKRSVGNVAFVCNYAGVKFFPIDITASRSPRNLMTPGDACL